MKIKKENITYSKVLLLFFILGIHVSFSAEHGPHVSDGPGKVIGAPHLAHGNETTNLEYVVESEHKRGI